MQELETNIKAIDSKLMSQSTSIPNKLNDRVLTLPTNDSPFLRLSNSFDLKEI